MAVPRDVDPERQLRQQFAAQQRAVHRPTPPMPQNRPHDYRFRNPATRAALMVNPEAHLARAPAAPTRRGRPDPHARHHHEPHTTRRGVRTAMEVDPESGFRINQRTQRANAEPPVVRPELNVDPERALRAEVAGMEPLAIQNIDPERSMRAGLQVASADVDPVANRTALSIDPESSLRKAAPQRLPQARV